MRRLCVVLAVFGLGVGLGRLWEMSAADSALAQGAEENGDTNGDGLRDVSDAVYLLSWLFQGGPEPLPIAICPQRFADNGDGTVTDRTTSLVWLRRTADANGDGLHDGLDRVTKSAAEALEIGFDFAGHEDWTLPNTRQLTSLVDPTRESAIDPAFELQSGLYWIGSTNGGDPCHGSNFVLGLGEEHLSAGFIELHGDFDSSSTAFVLLVRRP